MRFRREMTLLDLTMVSLGSIIGSGWLFAAQKAARVAGPAAVLAWVVGGVAVVLIGLCYAELGGLAPEAGGVVRYPQFSHGSFTSFLMGWAGWLAWVTVPAVEAEAMVQYASYYAPSLFVHGRPTAAGLAAEALLLLGFNVLNYLGVRAFAKTNTVLTLMKFVVPTLTAATLLATAFRPANFRAGGGFLPFGWHGLFSAVATGGVMLAYLGFRQAVLMGAEARDARRDVPRSLLYAIAVGVLLYVALQAAFIGALPGDVLARGWGRLDYNSPFADLASALGLGWLTALLLVDAVVSPAGTGIIYSATTARVTYALARNNYFPRAFLALHPRRAVPHWGILLNLVLGLLVLLPFPTWNRLVSVVSSATVITYMGGPVSALVLRRTAPDLPRAVRVGGLALVAPLAFVVAGLIVYWTGWPTTGEVLAADLAGVLVYPYYYRKNRLPARDLGAGAWLVAYLLFLTAASYLGTYGGRGVLPSPWDQLLVAAGSLAAFRWSLASGFETPEVARLRAPVHALED